MSSAMPCTTRTEQLAHAPRHVRARQHGVQRRPRAGTPTAAPRRGRGSSPRRSAAALAGTTRRRGVRAGDGELVGAHGRRAPGARPQSPAAWPPASGPWWPSSAPGGPPGPLGLRPSVGVEVRAACRSRARWIRRSARGVPLRAAGGPTGACRPWRCRQVLGARRRRSAGRGSAMASRRNRQSSTVCHAHAPGATAAISMVAPVGVMGRPVSSATWSSAMCASSSNLIRSAGSTLPSGSPPLATPWARVRARSIRAPPGDEPPMSWSRSPRICSRKLPPAPGPGNATPEHRRRGITARSVRRQAKRAVSDTGRSGPVRQPSGDRPASP